jgi:NSS family neurotransmitter:Na+ symporter
MRARHLVEQGREFHHNSADPRRYKYKNGKRMTDTGGSRVSIHGEWSSRWAFVLATSGSAIGLGSIWKFPYITGVNGGGAFVLVYLACITLIGLPIMVAEVLMGRRARQSPINAMRALTAQAGASKAWRLLGWSGVAAGFLILSYYTVIAGWSVGYIFNALSGKFTGAGAAEVIGIFERMIASPLHMLALHTLFMIMTVAVVARGVQNGLERAVTLMMPALFVLVIMLVLYAMTTGAFMQGVRFMFEPDFSQLTATGVMVAMGHAFFTLSLGMGAVMVYGSYMPANTSIIGASVMVIAMDTVISLLSGVMIFPLVFAYGLEPGQGPGLMFQTLPIAFGAMPGGVLIGAAFFLLLTFAAWSSAISLVEPAVAWMVENHGLSRPTACTLMGVAAWLFGFVTIFSFNIWSQYRWFDRSLFDLLDFVTANIMLPLGGIFIALFTGWVLPRDVTASELGTSARVYAAWRILVRYVAPVGVFIVLLNLLGMIRGG